MAIKDEYLQEALKVVPIPNILINMVSKRARQLKLGSKAMVQSYERLSPENVALKEIAEGYLYYRLPNEPAIEGQEEMLGDIPQDVV